MKAFLLSLKYFFRSPLWIACFLVCAAAATLPLVFAATPAVPVAIFDRDMSQSSQNILDDVSSSGLLEVRELSAGEAERQLATGELEAVFVIEEGAGQRLAAGDYRGVVTLALSRYSTGARTLSDTVAAAVMKEYSVLRVGSAVYGATGEEELSGLAMERARSSELEIITVERSGGVFTASRESGFSDAVAILGVAVCASALMFTVSFPEGFALLTRSRGKSPVLTAFFIQAGKVLPLILTAAIPLAVCGEDIPYVAGLMLLYACCLCAVCALLCRAELIFRLSAGVFLTVLNAIFALSEVMAGSPTVLSVFFPAYWLSAGVASGGWLPFAGLAAITGVCLAAGHIGRKRA